MKYILMCGGQYKKWSKPRQLTEINGETVVARTIRLLKENGVKDIYISATDPRFDELGVPIIKHNNKYKTAEYEGDIGYWVDAFYPTKEKACYIFGDVLFSEDAIKTIVEIKTDSIEFFASAPPFDERYIKPWAEPFAFKVVDQAKFRTNLVMTKQLEANGFFSRRPIAWELWQVIKGTPLNIIDYTNYTVINDWTCDIDEPEDIEKMKEFV